MVELFANSADPDQTPHSAASDLGLRCLPITLSGVVRMVNCKLLQMPRIFGYSLRSSVDCPTPTEQKKSRPRTSNH